MKQILKLYFVSDFDRWGYSYNVVWARNSEEAGQLVAPYSKRLEIEELEIPAKSKIVWCIDESPDSREWGD